MADIEREKIDLSNWTFFSFRLSPHSNIGFIRSRSFAY